MDIIINELQDIQSRRGYITEEDIIEFSKKKNIPKSQLYGVISFYSRLYTKPVGKHIIRICKSVSCGLNNNKPIIKKVEEILKIKDGEITEDKLELKEEIDRNR